MSWRAKLVQERSVRFGRDGRFGRSMVVFEIVRRHVGSVKMVSCMGDVQPLHGEGKPCDLSCTWACRREEEMSKPCAGLREKRGKKGQREEMAC